MLNDINSWDGKEQIVAQAKFDNDQQETGWMFLEVETEESVEDSLQAYAAGLLEGYLTRWDV